MPSASHQWLVTWIARKMVHDGFTVRGIDGSIPHGALWNDLASPFMIASGRPDIWGVHRDGSLAIGEAKTVDDIDTRHTRLQFGVYTSLFEEGLGRCRIYVAVPRSGVLLLDRVLATHASALRRVVRLHVPDCLLEAA